MAEQRQPAGHSLDSSHERGKDTKGCEEIKVVHTVRVERARRAGNAASGGELGR